MWFFFALLSMAGSLCWFMSAKVFPHSNPFAVLFVGGLMTALVALPLSRLAHGGWWDATALKPGAGFALGITAATAGLFYAINSGGKLGPTSMVIESWVVVATILGWLFYDDKLSLTQTLGCFTVFAGLFLVIK